MCIYIYIYTRIHIYIYIHIHIYIYTYAHTIISNVRATGPLAAAGRSHAIAPKTLK